jgi:hypothetical protein
MKVINFFGGAGIGKSSQAAGLFYAMKQLGHNVELINEYAKEMVWEENHKVMSDQLYLLAHQHRKQLRLVGKVDYCITDSPLLLNVIYRHMYGKPLYSAALDQMSVECHQKYQNINFVLVRQDTQQFQQQGRFQNMSQSIWVDQQISQLLDKLNEKYVIVDYQNTDTLQFLINHVAEHTQ